MDRWGRKLHTNQYSVNDYSRTVQHGQGVPGIFIKYDVEPLTMTVKTRTTSLTRFLVRLAGILGGVWVCAGFGYRIGDRMVRVVGKMTTGEEKSYEQYAQSFTSSLRTSSNQPGMASNRGSASRWMDGSGVGGMVGGMRDRATNAWGGNGLGHRPTASVSEKIYSGE